MSLSKTAQLKRTVAAINLAKAKVARDIKKIKQAEAYVRKVAQSSPPKYLEIRLFSKKIGKELSSAFSPAVVVSHFDEPTAEAADFLMEYNDVLTYQLKEIADPSQSHADQSEPADFDAFVNYIQTNYEDNKLNNEVD